MSKWHVEDWKTPAMIVLLVLLLGWFLVLGWEELLANVNSNSGDQGAYLELGIAIRGGKALSDGNRHPLFPLLIAPFASREWSYFTAAKLTSLACSGSALLITFFVGRRLYDGWTALLATALLAANQELVSHAPQVLCESLLVLTFIAAWYTGVRALGHLSSTRMGFAAGALAGLAYLTKGTGVILVLCFVANALVLYRRRAFQAHGLWAFVVAYLLVTSPLLIYNGTQYHNPFYNFSTTHAMWLDNWDDRYASSQDLPTVLTYLRDHSVEQALARQSHGMASIVPAMARAFVPGPNEGLVSWLQAGWVWPVLGFGLLLLVTLHWATTIAAYLPPRLPRLLLAGSLLGLFYLLFAWYAPVNDSSRFFLPLAPVLYLSLAEPLMSVARRAWGRTSRFIRQRRMVGVLVGVCLSSWAMVSSAQALQWSDPFAHDRLANRDPDQVVNWINGHAQDGLNILWGPSHTLPKWRFLPNVSYEAIPSDVSTWEQLERFVSEHDIHYVILDRKMYSWRDGVLSHYFDMEGARILFREVPPGWTLVFVQEGGETSSEWGGTNWYVLQMTPPGVSLFDPMEPVLLGSRIRLVGYRIEQTSLHPGDPLDLTLAWSVEAAPEEDYSAFVHVLDRQGRMWCQGDRSPLGGMYPTSRWKGGTQVIDRYRCRMDPRTPPGEYTIMVGMYRVDSRARLSATTGEGQPLPGDQIPVPEAVRVELKHVFEVPVGMQHPQTALVGSSIYLLGYDLPSEALKAGEVLPLTLYWRATSPITTSYTVFTHVLSRDETIQGQWDSVPDGGRRPTTEWLPGEVIVDPYNVPVQAETKAGIYRVEIGMYDATTGQRVPIFDIAGRRMEFDRVLLNTSIRVAE